MPCPRVPKPHDGQRLATTGRSVLMRGTERVQKPREATQGEAEEAPEAQPVVRDPRCRDWGLYDGNRLYHVGCDGEIVRKPAVARWECRACHDAWWTNRAGVVERV